MMDDKEKVIRYVLFYGDFTEKVSVKTLTLWEVA